MPIYEFRCQKCQTRFTTLVWNWAGASNAQCPHCGSNELNRLFSSFSVRKTDHDIYEDVLFDRQLVAGLRSNDPRALAEWNKRISRGEEVAPEHEEMLERLEAGEMPKIPNVSPDEKETEQGK